MTLAPEDNKLLAFPDLTPMPKGQLKVTSQPPGATVTVNGKVHGVTPLQLTLDELTEQAQDVTVEVGGLPGYQPSVQHAQLTAGESHAFAFTLSQGPATKTERQGWRGDGVDSEGGVPHGQHPGGDCG